MTFECGKSIQFTLRAWGSDQQSYVDMIWHDVSNKVALANGSKLEQFDYSAGIVDEILDHKIKTGLGFFQRPCNNRPGGQ